MQPDRSGSDRIARKEVNGMAENGKGWAGGHVSSWDRIVPKWIDSPGVTQASVGFPTLAFFDTLRG